MGRLNGIAKFIMININIFVSFFGTFFFGFALYLWSSDWGDLDPGFFVGSGIILALFGFILFFTGCIGCMSVDHQTKKVNGKNFEWKSTFFFF
jgi:hypothetical protein